MVKKIGYEEFPMTFYGDPNTAFIKPKKADKFQGKRAELGVYDDATNFTQDEREAYAKMLADNSFDTGLSIFDDKFWIEGDDSVEFVVPSPKAMHDKFTAEMHKGIADKIYEFAKLNTIDVLEGSFTINLNNTSLMEEQKE